MGIEVEFNPELALRKHGTRGRRKEECLPEQIMEGTEYAFLKAGQRNYYMRGDISLVETAGEGMLAAPVANVRIIEATHFTNDGQVFTRGTYRVTKLLDFHR